MWLAEPREARASLPAGTDERPVGAYAYRHEDIVDIDALVDRPVHAPAVGHGLDGDHEARRERAGQERGGVEADDVGGVKGVQAEACACTDRMSVYAHRSTLASSASDGRHEHRANLQFARCQRRRRCTTADVLNESAGTGSQAHVTTRR